MHELSLAEEILRILEDTARARGFEKVRNVGLSIGLLSGVEPDSLLFCLDLVFRGSLAEGSRISLLRPEGEGWCRSCSQSVRIEAFGSNCPLCGGGPVHLEKGTEFRIVDIDVI